MVSLCYLTIWDLPEVQDAYRERRFRTEPHTRQRDEQPQGRHGTLA